MGIVKFSTSRFSFVDWTGVFYLPGTNETRWSSFYVYKFDTVEINSTYFRIPAQKVFDTLDEKTSQNFEYIVKVHKEVTDEIENYNDSLKVLHKHT